MVVAFGVAESPEGDSLYAYPVRESLWSPNGVAKIMQGAKPVRLAAEAFLLFVQKEPKYAWGCAPRPPNAKLRLDTNDAKASSVRRRRYAPKVPAAHFYVEIVDRVPLPRCGEGGRGKGQMLPQATFGAHLCAVRICFSRLLREKQHS